MWPEDEEDEMGYPIGMEALASYLLAPGANIDKYGNAVPLTANNSANYMQDIFQMLSNPQTAMMMSALTGAGTVDYMQEPDPQDVEPEPVPFTPTLDALRQEDPQLASIIESGTTYATIAKGIREANEDPEGESAATKDQLAMAQAAIDERNSAAKEFAEFQRRPVPLSPIEEQYRKAGLPMPWEQYTGDTVDGDFAALDSAAELSRRKLEAEMPRNQRALDAFMQKEADPLPEGQRVGPNGENLFLDQFKPGGRLGTPLSAGQQAPRQAVSVEHDFGSGGLRGIGEDVGRFFDDPAWDFNDNGKGAPPAKLWMGPNGPVQGGRSTGESAPWFPQTGTRAPAKAGFDFEAQRHRLQRQKLMAAVSQDKRDQERGTTAERAARDAKNIAALRARQAGRTPHSDNAQQRLALLRAAGIPI